MKRILIAALALIIVNAMSNGVFAAKEDDEISIMAAEQRRFNEADVTVSEDEIETFDSQDKNESNDNAQSGDVMDNVSDNNNVTQEDINNDMQNLNDHKSNENLDNTVADQNDNGAEMIKPDVDVTSGADIVKPYAENLQDSVGMPSPIVTYSSFNEAAKKVGFIPLYIPRKSGFVMNYIAVISNNIVEIRYGRRWEPNVTLSLRTYKRKPGEELKDISGVYGVKWKVDLSSGTTIYIARISDNTNVAAWSIGQYTFAAMTDNLSFAAFHALIIEEIVDLCNHYFIDINN